MRINECVKKKVVSIFRFGDSGGGSIVGFIERRVLVVGRTDHCSLADERVAARLVFINDWRDSFERQP